MLSCVSDRTRWIGCRRLFGASNLWFGSPSLSIKLLYDRFHAHMRWLRRQSDVHIIHIVREDHTAWLKSKFVAKAVGAYVGSSYPADIEVTIPIGNALRRVEAKVWIDGQLTQLAHSNPYLRISYEDFGQRLPDLGRQAADFLGENGGEIDVGFSTIERQSEKSTEQYVANFAELNAALAKRGYLT